MTAPAWSAHGDGWALYWSPTPPHLDGTPAVVAAVVAYLDRVDVVAVTPTGPFLDPDPADALAVLGALAWVAPGPWRSSPSAPYPPGVPPGAPTPSAWGAPSALHGRGRTPSAALSSNDPVTISGVSRQTRRARCRQTP